MYSTILIATDGSELAAKAVVHGARLAGRLGASVVIVTVTEMWSALAMAEQAGVAEVQPVARYEAAAKIAAADILANAKDRAKAEGVEAEILHIPDRSPAVGILEAADMQEADLIVMASHGRRGLGRMLMGSQTAEVLAFSKVPVLVLR